MTDLIACDARFGRPRTISRFMHLGTPVAMRHGRSGAATFACRRHWDLRAGRLSLRARSATRGASDLATGSASSTSLTELRHRGQPFRVRPGSLAALPLESAATTCLLIQRFPVALQLSPEACSLRTAVLSRLKLALHAPCQAGFLPATSHWDLQERDDATVRLPEESR